MFPRGNTNVQHPKHIALYLDFPDANITPVHMQPEARFELVAENQTDPTKSIRLGTHGRPHLHAPEASSIFVSPAKFGV